MPSAALQHWTNDRTLRLTAVGVHCGVSATVDPLLAEESLRAYVMLLSGHFQGFCRDLYTECSQVITSAAPVNLQLALQSQLATEVKLDSGNPTVEAIRKDFERFGFMLDFNVNHANGPRLTHLGQLNKWRNAVAHQKPVPPAGVPPLTLAAVQGWRTSCDELAAWLDGFVYNKMAVILGRAPW